MKQSSLIDRRSYKIQLTPRGKEYYSKFIDLINNTINLNNDYLSLQNKEYLENILNELNWKLSLINK